MKWTLGVLLVAVCGFAQAADKAQTQTGTCDTLAAAFEDGVKELSFSHAQGMFETSAAREANLQLEKVATTNLMQMHLTLLAANKCPLPKTPLSDNAYGDDAFACAKDIEKNATSGNKDFPASCDRAKWTRGFLKK
jgi:hypothetical protein